MRSAVLDMASEVPLRSLEGLGDASENYAWFGYDVAKEIGFFAHLGRWSLDRELWREQLYVYLPDRTVLAYRGFGRQSQDDGPAAAIQRHRCLAPGKRWTIQHHGPVWHLDARELVRGPAAEPVVERLVLDVEFTGDFVPFMYPESDNTSWGQWHYEQAGSITGSIRFGDLDERFAGFAYRDHTRGPRNLTNFRGSNWVQGLLPDGTAFALFQTWHDNGGGRVSVGLNELTLTTSDTVESAVLIDHPGYESLDDLTAAVPIAFDCSRGRVTVTGEPLNMMIFSATSRHEILFGAARGNAPLVVAEQPLRLDVDGQPGVAHCERSRLMTPEHPRLKLDWPPR